MEKLISCSEAQENPELEEFGSCVSALSVLLQCCPAKCFRISCSVRELRERRKKRLSCHFPFSVCLPAPGDETCQWLLPEVPVPCEGWQRGLQQWLGVALTDTLAEGPLADQELTHCVMSCQGKCWFGKLLPLPVGLGTFMSKLRVAVASPVRL